MMTHLSALVVRYRKAVLGATVLLLVVAGAVGRDVTSRAQKGNFLVPPSAESSRAAKILAEKFGQPEPNVVLLVTARRGTVDEPTVAQDGLAVTAEASRVIGSPTVSYWTLGSPPPLRSRDATQALVLGHIDGSDNQVDKQIGRVATQLERQTDLIEVTVTGRAQSTHQFLEASRKDARRGELLAGPLLLITLVLVFGGVVAAVLPLAIAALVVVALTFFALRLLVQFTYVHDNMLNLITIMALGLAVDYCLFIVSRFREELAAGSDPDTAVIRTMQTAGATVLFSAGAVTVALAAMLLFPNHLNSWALTGLAAVTAGLGAVIVLPALLAVLGHRVDSLRLFRRSTKPDGRFWHRLATLVMHRPLPIALASVALLVCLGAPFLKVTLSLPDERWLPAGATSRRALEQIRRDFTSNDAFSLPVVAPASGDPSSLRTVLTHYASNLSALPGVGRVDTFTGSFSAGQQIAPETPISRQRFTDRTNHGTWLTVLPTPDVTPLAASGERLVHRVRSAPAPFPVMVGGQSAQLVDSKDAILGRLPIVLGLLIVMNLTILFLLFGSVLVPIKAVILNVISLTATFGAMVWVFQEGNGSGLLKFTPTGALDTFLLIMIFCVAFGLSMDYEVFLLSRIKEEHDRGFDNIRSVAAGLEHTGGIVTAAAASIAIVFFSLLPGKILGVKMFGLGMGLAVLVDATVIRGLLVPAFMRLAGNANWWAPRPLRRMHQRLGFHHASSGPASTAPSGSLSLPDATLPLPHEALIEEGHPTGP